MVPFLLKPAFKDYIWGGNALKERFHKETGLAPLAESWELSAHPDGECAAASGPLAGMPLGGIIRQHPQWMGTAYDSTKPFPMLLKLIDARQNLSVQVHPDDAFAAREEGGLGKTEMWYILESRPGAFLYLGFQRPLSREELRKRISDGTLTQVLHKEPVKPGEAYFIQAGTVHAIGEGIVLAEIQQNSNTTYRVYDFGRVGKDGKPRELHIEKAAQVADLGPASFEAPGRGEERPIPGGTLRRLARCASFTTHVLCLEGEAELPPCQESFLALLCTQGECALAAGGSVLRLRQGESAFLPAGLAARLSGSCRLMLNSLGGEAEG